jgi:hypothetical protein
MRFRLIEANLYAIVIAIYRDADHEIVIDIMNRFSGLDLIAN